MQVLNKNQIDSSIPNLNKPTQNNKKYYFVFFIIVIFLFLALIGYLFFNQKTDKVQNFEDIKKLLTQKQSPALENVEEIKKTSKNLAESAFVTFSSKYSDQIINNQITQPEKPIVKVGTQQATIELFQDLDEADKIKQRFEEVSQGLALLNSCSDKQQTFNDFDDFNLKKNACEQNFDKLTSKKVDGERISVWFNNLRDESIPEERARSYAYNLISRVRSEIVNNGLSFKQASEIIISEDFIKELDKSYNYHAYYEFRIYDGNEKFLDLSAKQNQMLWDLKPGETSEIIETDNYYAIFTINKQHNSKNVEEINVQVL